MLSYRTNASQRAPFPTRQRAPIAIDPADYDPEPGDPDYLGPDDPDGPDDPGTNLPKIATCNICGALPHPKVDNPDSNPIPDCDTGENQMTNVETQTAAAKKKAPAKKKTSAKKTTSKKTTETSVKHPGVIAAIIAVMSRERGATANECLEILKSKFEDRDPEKMAATIRTQLNRQKTSSAKDEKRGIVYFKRR